jgi:hypothetical protein
MPAFLVASPLADMAATGSGVIESQEHTAAAHTTITHEFRISLSKTHDLFGAFSWADVNTEGAVDVSSGQSNFTIALDESKFEAAMAYVIANALGGKPAATFGLSTSVSAVPGAQTAVDPSNLSGVARTAQNILDREVRLEVEAELNANGVLEYLEGDSLGNFALALDASGGASDMYSKLSVDAALRNLFLQIPNRTSEVGLTDASGSRLPVAAGDAIAFVFSVAPAVTISQATESADASSPAGASANALGPTTNMTLNGSTILTTDDRKIAFVVEVTA